jgi:hypothetical protein
VDAVSQSGGSNVNEDKRYTLRAIDQMAIGSIILLWGSLLMLKQIGIIDRSLSTWPFVFVAFGILLIAGSIYRLYARGKSTHNDLG